MTETKRLDRTRGCRGALAILLLLVSTKAPAPPPPDLTCTDGVPAVIQLAFPDQFDGGIGYANSVQRVPAYKVVDASGHSLRNATLTFAMQPYVAGMPGGHFAHYAHDGNLVVDETRVAQASSGDSCEPIESPPIVANDVLGLWNVVISTGNGVRRNLRMSNHEPDPVASLQAVYSGVDYASPGGRFAQSHTVEVRPAIAGLAIHFTAPSTGPAAHFADGTSTATVVTDAQGRAAMPELTANAIVGAFEVYATVANKPGEPVIPKAYLGLMVIGGATITRVTPLANTVLDFGQSAYFQGNVSFEGLPHPEWSFDGRVPPVGTVSLVVDDTQVLGTSGFGFPYASCASCPDTAFLYALSAVDLPFGTHRYQVEYEGAGVFGDSASPVTTLTVNPNATATTANGSTSAIGLYDNACKASAFKWQASVAGASYPPDLQFPYGVLRYTLGDCASHDGFGGPVLAEPTLVLQFDAALPSNTVFMAYGPTPDSASSTWHTVPSRVQGNRLYVSLQDGGLGDDQLGTEDALAGLGGPAFSAAGADVVDVVEYYNAALDHYFMTASREEMDVLDTGAIAGWSRTGASFKAHASSSSLNPVCRFYIPPAQGDSHFYSAFPQECNAARLSFPTFVEESADAFRMDVPSPEGTCPAGTSAVYRVWNQRADSNHRYTTSLAIRDQMLQRGYAAEGFGPKGVVMCAAEGPAGVLASRQRKAW